MSDRPGYGYYDYLLELSSLCTMNILGGILCYICPVRAEFYSLLDPTGPTRWVDLEYDVCYLEQKFVR